MGRKQVKWWTYSPIVDHCHLVFKASLTIWMVVYDASKGDKSCNKEILRILLFALVSLGMVIFFVKLIASRKKL